MYPGTIFNWHDKSQIGTVATSTVDKSAPLFMQVFSADKGTEDLIEIGTVNDFDAMYGTMSFTKHGQSAIQAKAIIDAGGRLYAKRVVASDATLANVVLCANVSKSGENTVVKWTSHIISNCKTFNEVKTAALALLNPTTGVYPLFLYTDNGRGVSSKAVRLTPDYSTSKTIGKTFYTLSVYEGTTITEKTSITFDPTVIYNDNAYRLDEYTNVQISGLVLDSVYEQYLQALSTNLTIEVATLRTYDIIYGYTNKGVAIPKFTLDAASVDLDAATGIAMSAGTNGSFGTAPVGTTSWEEAIKQVFDGTYSNEVFDVDKHKIAAIVDANYPQSVKDAIFDLVAFRQDCVFLRDYGTGLTTYLQIKDAYVANADRRNYFTGDYCTSYMIKDPETKKNIEVTCTYDMASLMAVSLKVNPYAPLAGIANGFILSNAIEGTINFTPVNTPAVNQLSAMEDIKVNYAVFQDGKCIMQSTYSCQDPYTQLSYISNVIAIQAVLRAVRTNCPAQRYTLVSGNDLSDYSKAVNRVLSNFSSNFSVLNFVYTKDDIKTQQKIFYASIEFAFLNWAQTEIFDVYAINA